MDPVMKTEQKEVQDWAVQNDNKPLWTRSPREVLSAVVCISLLRFPFLFSLFSFALQL